MKIHSPSLMELLLKQKEKRGLTFTQLSTLVEGSSKDTLAKQFKRGYVDASQVSDLLKALGVRKKEAAEAMVRDCFDGK